jgi:2-polyprenyl-3-methyl-5-hydroxy-6-metoxy-1,4-benzoquinol methylase
MPRYALIAGFAKVSQPAKSILDVGCGDGQLIDWVCRDNVQRYVGVDLSKVALEQARLAVTTQQCLARGIDVRFEAADGMTYSPDQKFDAIVFNEVLYYAPEPGSVLKHYGSFLNTNGIFIISMFRSAASLHTWRRCAPVLELVGEVRLRGGNGFEWDIRLCRLK